MHGSDDITAGNLWSQVNYMIKWTPQVFNGLLSNLTLLTLMCVGVCVCAGGLGGLECEQRLGFVGVFSNVVIFLYFLEVSQVRLGWLG